MDGYDNLILLCASDHRLIDSQPRKFPTATVCELNLKERTSAGWSRASRCRFARNRKLCSRMPVQAAAGPVVPHRGPRIRVRGRLLHVVQRHPGIQGCGDERVPERVRADGLGDPGAAGGFADDPPGAVPVQPPPSPAPAQP